MAGIYIHIPFCKSRCIYCGFYSTTQAELRQRYVDAVCREMELRGEKWGARGERIDTIYLGGGTPSQLTPAQLEQLFIYINKVYAPASKEITIECNPDDVTEEYVAMLSQLPVNRVSMGVQTFSDGRLQFLHRRHTSGQIPVAVERLRKAGIGNISIDLMYGFPDETLDEWHRDIRQALDLQVEHLSAYALTYEEGTVLYRMLKEGKVHEVDEELERQMYYDLIDHLEARGFEHYEISNFAKPGFRSIHNSSYWNQTPYLGLGAAAHSYDGRCRWANVADVMRYIRGIEEEQPVVECEVLDDDTRYNDLVMTALRTCEGLPLHLLSPRHRDYCLQTARKYIVAGQLVLSGDYLRLSRQALFVSDMMMADLMKV